MSVMAQVLQGTLDLHGDDAATVTGRAARVGERLNLLGVAAADFGGELAAHALSPRQVADLREVLRPSGDRADHDPQATVALCRRDGDTGPILTRTRAKLPVDGAPLAARYPELRHEFVLFECGLVVVEDKLVHRYLTLPPRAARDDPRVESREHRRGIGGVVRVGDDPAYGRLVPDARAGDDREGEGQRRPALPHYGRALDGPVGGHRPETQDPAVGLDMVEVRDAAEGDEHRRGEELLVHHDPEEGAAGDDGRLLPVLSAQNENLVQRARLVPP